MSWVCGNEPDDSSLTVLPERGHPNSLDLASLELAEAVLDGEDVVIPTSRMWRECYITITKRTYDMRLAWQTTNGGDGAVLFRPDEAWSNLLDIWAGKWPKGIPSFVNHTPPNECVPPYKCDASQEQSQPIDFCRYSKKDVALKIQGRMMVEVLVGDEVAIIDPNQIFAAGRFRVKESETGVEFVLRRVDGSEVIFFLGTADLGRAELQRVLETWCSHDIGVIYQDDSGTPAPLLSQHRMVSKDEIPRDTLGLAYDEGTRDNNQVFFYTAQARKECSIFGQVFEGYLDITLVRTNWVKDVLYIPFGDERLFNAFRKSMGGNLIRNSAVVQDFTPEAASAYTWEGKIAAPSTSSQIVPSANNAICFTGGTFVEATVGGETHYIEESQLFKRVHAQFGVCIGRWQIEVTHSDGAVERIVLTCPPSEENFKAEDVLPCWRSVYPDGTTGLMVRRKVSLPT